MRTHELKCWPEPFQATLDGKKRHEWRSIKDRWFEEGDVLLLREWEPKMTTYCPHPVQRGECYTGRSQRVVVTYVSCGFGIPPDFVVMSITPETKPHAQ